MFRNFMEACEYAEKKYRGSTLLDMMDQEYYLIRSRLLRLSRPLLVDLKYGQKVLETLWKSAFYSLIQRMRSSTLSEHQRAWCDMQISILVGELCRIGMEFSELQSVVCIYLGDLRRYAWLFFSRERDKMLATIHYRNVTEMDGGGGLVYNQLGLLVQDSEPIRALLYFLLACTFSQRPFPGAFANIIGLLARYPTMLEDPIVAVIEHCLTNFSRFEFQELMNNGLEQIQAQLDAKNTLYISTSITLMTLAVPVLLAKEKHSEVRYLTEMLLKTAEGAVRAFENWPLTRLSAVRRRHASEVANGEAAEHSSTESVAEDEDEGEDIVELDSDDNICSGTKIGELSNEKSRMEKSRYEMQMLLVALLHFATSASAQIYSDRSIPAALKHQHELLCQNLCRLLNKANCVLKSSAQFPLWHLGTDTSPCLLPKFLEDFALAESTPVQYDGFFRFISNSSREEDLMKNMAKIRLLHESKKEEARAWIPVYVVPEKDVLITRLWVVKGIVKKGAIIVVIAEDTLREMDKLKKEKLGAREAIRFIESQISNGNGRLRVENSSSPQDCAEKLAAQTQLTDAVVVVILTISKVDSKLIPKCEF